MGNFIIHLVFLGVCLALGPIGIAALVGYMMYRLVDNMNNPVTQTTVVHVHHYEDDEDDEDDC